MGSLRVRKWYLDCTAPDGRAAIVYWGHVQMPGFTFGLASATLVGPGEPPQTQRRLDAGPEPAIENCVIRFGHTGLNLRGMWRARCPAIDEVLLEMPDGRVDWRCEAPGAEAQIEYAGSTIRGTGYAERLDMTIAPWALPIRTLRWGRVVTQHHACTWIQWEGPVPRANLWLDGVAIPEPSISDGLVTAWDISIQMDQHTSIRDGAIGSTILARLPLLPAAARRALAIVERKWLSHTTVQIRGEVEQAWAIHEVVTWPAE